MSEPIRDEAEMLEVPALAMNQSQAAEALNVSVRTLRSWTRQGRIPHAELNGILRYPTVAIEAWLAAQTRGGSDAIGTP